MSNYAVRISRTFKECEDWLIKCSNDSIKVLVYEHPADKDVSRTHIHALFTNVNTTTETLKNWLKATLGVNNFPRTDWSFKTEYYIKETGETIEITNKPNKFITYMSKGCIDPLMNTSDYDDDDINMLKGMWIDFKNKSAKPDNKVINAEVVITNVVKKTKKELMADIAELLIQRHADKAIKDFTVREIASAVMEVLKENRVITNMYKMTDYIDTYNSWYRGDSFLDTLENYYVKSRYRT